MSIYEEYYWRYDKYIILNMYYNGQYWYKGVGGNEIKEPNCNIKFCFVNYLLVYGCSFAIFMMHSSVFIYICINIYIYTNVIIQNITN